MTPEPQVVTIGLARSTPAASNAARKSSPRFQLLSASKNSLCGRLREPGIWPEARPGARLRRLAGEARRGAGVDDVVAVLPEQIEHGRLVDDGPLVEQGGEMAVPVRVPAAFQRPALGGPFLQAAVERWRHNGRRTILSIHQARAALCSGLLS